MSTSQARGGTALDNDEMLLVLQQSLSKKRVLIVDRHTPARDSLRLMLGALGVTAVLLAVSWGGTSYPWNSPVIIGLFVAGTLLLTAFVFVELRVPEPVVPLRLFRTSIFTFANLGAFGMSMVMFGSIIYVPIYAQGVLAVNASTSGLITLPLMPYEVADWVYGRRVQANSHVAYARNWYSVPYAYAGTVVDLRVGSDTLEVWHKGSRLCTHRLLPATAANRYSTNETDLPGKAGWRQWDRERCERWAKRVGPDCADVVGRLFAAQRFDDQGVEPALAVLRLSRRYSERRLENACSLALQSVASPRYSHIRPILETGQDMTGGLTETSDDGAGGWVRGGDYYANMGR
mgnify:CR=1 FL=1